VDGWWWGRMRLSGAQLLTCLLLLLPPPPPPPIPPLPPLSLSLSLSPSLPVAVARGKKAAHPVELHSQLYTLAKGAPPPKPYIDANGVEMVPIMLRGGMLPRGLHPRAPRK